MHVPVHEDGLRTQAGGCAQWHRGMNAELAGCIGRRSHDAALIGFAADDHRFAFERRIKQFFDGNEECVHIEMANQGLHSVAPMTRGQPAKSEITSKSSHCDREHLSNAIERTVAELEIEAAARLHDHGRLRDQAA